MRLILLRGLNPDANVFSKLASALPNSEVVDWNLPPNGNSLHGYAQRIVDEYKLNADCDLLGVSFGGVVAQEIAAIIRCRYCFVVSSVVSVNELRFPAAVVRFLPFSTNERLLRILGKLSMSQKRLRRSRKFGGRHGTWYCWAVSRIVSWKEPKLSPDTSVVRIHGDRDTTFPLKAEVEHLLVGAGHLACVTHAEEITGVVLTILEKSDQDATDNPYTH